MISAGKMRESRGKEEEEGRHCRFCRSPLEHLFLDLKAAPLSNSYLTAEDLNCPEPFYPLRVYVCSQCFLVQLEEPAGPEEIFSDYAYFSSFSTSWLDHSQKFAREAINIFNLGESSRVVEIGSNDGYLLHFFRDAAVPVLGIEPAANVAREARKRGVETLNRFFDSSLAEELSAGGVQADLLVGNNVLAHIPDVNDLMRGLKIMLKPDGVISMEFPHLLSLVEKNQFDTIYHEHYSYYSLTAADRVFGAHDLLIFDAELLSTHGGSLRIYAGHAENGALFRSKRAAGLLEEEEKKGFKDIKAYSGFQQRVQAAKREILKFMITAREEGKSIAGYGAPAKGNTLLNYCGIGTDFIDYTVDKSPHKQGRFLPGSRIPICDPEQVARTRPDYLLILPWNLEEEIRDQMSAIRNWGGQFLVLIPEVRVIS